jgi:MoxR-like ATPase
MDRFLMHVRIDYPSDADEVKVLQLVRGEEAQGATPEAPTRIAQQAVFDARAEIDAVKSVEAIEAYIVALIAATRRPADFGGKLEDWIAIGASPRGSLALDRCSRVHAWLHGRDHVLPSDVQAIVHDCLRHRVTLSYEASAEGVTRDKVIDEIVARVAVAG